MPDLKPPLRTYRIADLGCKVNQYESQLLAEHLESYGLSRANKEETADICIVNGCAITAAALGKSARTVRQLRRRNPGSLLVVAGCAVSAAGKENILDRTGADLALEQHEKMDLSFLNLQKTADKDGAQEIDGISRFDSHSRAFLKIQDGCESFCSYCIVPSLRGPSRSRSLASIAKEATALQQAGHRELVICGVHIGLFGRDLPGRPTLADALQAVLDSAPETWLRISSLDPSEVSDDLLKLMASQPRLLPHLHLPLQSGDGQILKSMRRRYSPEGFLETVHRVRSNLDRPAITTDVIVGFPGETQAAFENTMQVSRSAAFNRMHIFPFSPRAGTDAAEMPDQVNSNSIRSRISELTNLADQLAADYAATCVGTEEQVLAEEILEDGSIAGYSSRYMRTSFKNHELHDNKTSTTKPQLLKNFHQVKITAHRGADLIGEVIPG